MLKKEIRIIAWDDCAFRFSQKSVRIVGAIFRGGDFMDGLLSTIIRKDGMDVTQKMCESILKTRHYDQLSLVLTNGISFGGLNILDINELHRQTRLPVLAVVRKKPDRKQFIDALKKLEGGNKRVGIVRKTGIAVKEGEIYFQKAGLTRKECSEILGLTCTRSNIPEPLRVVHLIASGLSRRGASGWESRGRA